MTNKTQTAVIEATKEATRLVEEVAPPASEAVQQIASQLQAEVVPMITGATGGAQNDSSHNDAHVPSSNDDGTKSTKANNTGDNKPWASISEVVGPSLRRFQEEARNVMPFQSSTTTKLPLSSQQQGHEGTAAALEKQLKELQIKRDELLDGIKRDGLLKKVRY